MKRCMKVALSAFACLTLSTAMAARVDLLDQCDAADPAWTSVGGCALEEGDFTFAEFAALAASINSSAVVGHPAWTIEPSYASQESGDKLHVTNRGGRAHTFTEVATFGGGIIALLNAGLTPAPECAAAVTLAPGQSAELRPSSPGLRLFQCCIHPWMRAAIRTSRREDERLYTAIAPGD